MSARKFAIVFWTLLALTILSAPLLMMSGCQDMKAIPVFNPDAPLKNRIASALEVYTEISNGISDARDSGLITQTQINAQWSPRLDAARKLISDADTLRAAGTTAASTAKLDTAKDILIALRSQLTAMKRDNL